MAAPPQGIIYSANVPSIFYSVISSGMATLMELETYYSIKDVYDMLEINSVKLHNQNVINKAE